MGINVDRTIVTVFAIGGAMAGRRRTAVRCWCSAASTSSPGSCPGIKAFTAAVLGGIGNIIGAMVGGLILGRASSRWGRAWCSPGSASPRPTSSRTWWRSSVLVLVLIFRPGHPGRAAREERASDGTDRTGTSVTERRALLAARPVDLRRAAWLGLVGGSRGVRVGDRDGRGVRRQRPAHRLLPLGQLTLLASPSWSAGHRRPAARSLEGFAAPPAGRRNVAGRCVAGLSAVSCWRCSRARSPRSTSASLHQRHARAARGLLRSSPSACPGRRRSA